MDNFSASSDSGGESDTSNGNQDTATTTKQEELVTKLQLRLTASHLPKVVGGGGLKKLVRKRPDTFATVASIVRKTGSGSKGTRTVSPYRSSQYGETEFQSSEFNFNGSSPESDYMVEWGSTEVIQNSRSPQWIETIPLKYEYGSELFFYVRILQADPLASNSEDNGSRRPSNGGALSPLSQSSSADDASVASQSFYGTPTNKKNRMGHCFGTALFEVGDILGSRNYTKVKRLKAGGCVYARVEPVQERDQNKLRFRFQFQALNLMVGNTTVKSRLLGSAEPTTVLEISRPHDSPSMHSWVTVFRSRPVYNSSNPSWDRGEVDLDSICRNDDLSKIVRLSIYRIRSGNKPQQLLGMCETTLYNIMANCAQNEDGGEACSERDFFLQRNYRQLQQVGSLRVHAASLVTLSGRDVSKPLATASQILPVSPLSASSSSPIGRTNSTDSTTTANGEDPFNVDLRQLSMRFSATQSTPTTSLSEFMDSGGQIDFSVAIDYTSSNGNPLEPGTLHFQSEETFNDYEETITCIGNAIDKYSKSSEYSVWGFGAKFGDGVVRHLFQCGQSPTVKGVDGILDAYRSVFRSGGITMSGPTVFLKAIQSAAVRARKSKMDNTGGPLRYSVLLIVTDGIMANFEETKQKLAVYSEVPLSVVIVGVGRSDFQAMYHLCESPQSTATARKNTTFVEFRQHQHDPRSLAQAALQEIPRQLSDYMVSNGLSMQ
ncbi:Nicotinic receptor-associated protein 1 [Seminavis robusta]|uniref:Nicotinic receptor-associated protein 1 n=1 Tax=Seminavis robusta TaxID=568900 RepID=A0A9N8DXH2_9STRA|nr:Nicotinic receptor-associated protein 1 [Seminavis robusta]|eukprot:Sro421_g139480.1 Nicotinic receptor-associated protein 1 (717) ;mRNA; f:15966-18675